MVGGLLLGHLVSAVFLFILIESTWILLEYKLSLLAQKHMEDGAWSKHKQAGASHILVDVMCKKNGGIIQYLWLKGESYIEGNLPSWAMKAIKVAFACLCYFFSWQIVILLSDMLVFKDL